VAGAGVIGLCVALDAQARGAEVTLVDPGQPLANASAIAAGMVAPAFESALEEEGQGRLGLFRAARDLWAEVAHGAVTLRGEGALWAALPGEEAELARVGSLLQREGAEWTRLSAEEARELNPRLTRRLIGAVFTPEDARVDPGPALELLADVFRRQGGRRVDALLTDPMAELRASDAVVLCAGWGSSRLAKAAPELRTLRPIGGELVRFPGAETGGGPVIRTSGGYLVPGQAGLIAGATMVDGSEVQHTTAETQTRYARLARSFLPGLKHARYEGAAGIRAATPDGLPLVGRSRTGVQLVTGFRRNGWLLAPLAARITADQLAGHDPGPWAEAFRPDRFG
jgi:glycine oxidase